MVAFHTKAARDTNRSILVLSLYFQPDLSAGSFRNTSLVDELQSRLEDGTRIDVITSLPSRYASYSVDAPQTETHGPLTINRVHLPAHRNGMLDQVRSFAIYAMAVLSLTKGRRYELVYGSSSRLMTASLASFVARRTGAKLYLDIRDNFVETIAEVLPRKLSWLFVPVFSVMEKLTVSRADRVNLVSEGFLPYFRSRYQNTCFSLFTNGIDEEFVKSLKKTTKPRGDSTILVLYAGNFGEGQGLEHIIPELAKRLEQRASFVLFGDGARRRELEAELEARKVVNVKINPPVPREALIDEYLKSDVLFLHLNDHAAFLNVLPSKIFEYAALGKPVWAGVGGFAARFLEREVENVAVFNPGDADKAMETFNGLVLETRQRTAFIQKFSRRKIMKNMSADILSLLRTENR